MITLGIETSTQRASVALFSDQSLIGSEVSMDFKLHSEFVSPAISKLLKKNNLKLSDIDLYACGKGPGSFTGVRVATNIVRTFSFVFQKPLVAIDSLTLLSSKEKDKVVVPILNAYKNMVYCAAISHGKFIFEPVAIKLTDFFEYCQTQGVADFVLCGDGLKAYSGFFSKQEYSYIPRLNEDFFYPRAENLMDFGIDFLKRHQTQDWKSIEPLYIRASEAEENLRTI